MIFAKLPSSSPIDFLANCWAASTLVIMFVGILDTAKDPPRTAKLVPRTLIILIIFVRLRLTQDFCSRLFNPAFQCYDLLSTLPDTIFGWILILPVLSFWLFRGKYVLHYENQSQNTFFETSSKSKQNIVIVFRKKSKTFWTFIFMSREKSLILAGYY